jgi:hypothetical protein
MNFWKQTNHIMAYFKEENFRGDKRLPGSFMTGFLEVSIKCSCLSQGSRLTYYSGSQLDLKATMACVYILLKGIPQNASITIMLHVNANTFKSP